MKKYILILLIFTYLFLIANPPDWEPITGTEFSMILFARIAYNDTFFTSNEENIVAAFGPGGDSDCRCIAGWQDYDPYGFWYFNIVGNINGEMITFKFYDSVTDNIYECLQTYEFQDNANIGSPTEPALLSIDASLITGNISLSTTSPPAGNILDVIITNGTYTAHPNIYGNYQLSADPGTYNVTASLNDYNPVTITDVEVLEGQQTINIDFNLIDWVTITGTQYNMVFMCQVFINDEPFEGDINNHLAAFGPAGIEDCRGVAVWQEANPPYWDGYWFFTIVSNTQADSIYFSIFDSSSGNVYECQESILFENDATIGSPDEPFEINVDLHVIQHINPEPAWNWISFNVHPQDIAIESVFAPLEPFVYQVKNQLQSVIYYESIDTWLGDLSQITDGESYLIYMSNTYNDFSLEGVPIPVDRPIPLTAEWNWIAYFPQSIYDLDIALSSIVPEVIQVKTQAQSANYIDPPGYWVGDLLQMEPGIGYKIDMSSAAQLIYGSRDTNNNPQQPPATDDPPLWELINGTQYSMVYMANIILDGEAFTGDDENLAAAFGNAGDSDCRSIAAWQQPNPPAYDGFWYFTIIGNTEGEDIQFQIYDSLSDQVFTSQQSITFENNNTIGSPFEPAELIFYSSSEDNNELPDINSLCLNIYPNPFNPETTISFYLDDTQKVNLSIYNLKGQRIINLFDSILPQGDHKIGWDGKDNLNKKVSSGIYLIKLSLPEKTITKKTLLLK
ncbi:MAG: T9SS type A sorting domain-containing protein [Candidatus Stygibacter australis]|nr:T9SS type A sorting domain-containing protein [Candidatus Stygibacter australis]